METAVSLTVWSSVSSDSQQQMEITVSNSQMVVSAKLADTKGQLYRVQQYLWLQASLGVLEYIPHR